MTSSFIWYELVTNDLDAAQAFYGDVVGWTAAPFPGSVGNEYRIFSHGEAGIGGLMPLPDGMTKPFWLGYIGTDDCDTAVAQATAAGATLHRVMDVPDVGKIALVSDPQGVGYSIIQGYSDRKSEAFHPTAPGHARWNELFTTDGDAGFAYYAGLYGWTKGLTLPMGPMGVYQLFQVDGVDHGGIMRAPEGFGTRWITYFGVSDVEAAAARITQAGGTIIHGPHEVPGGEWVVQFTDPQGAIAAVVGPRTQGA